ncbi:MAG: hypothetical protein U1E76_10305 [Planctomycetota bacterium]
MKPADLILGVIDLVNRVVALVLGGVVLIYLLRPQWLAEWLVPERIEQAREPLLWGAGALVAANLLPLLQVSLKPRGHGGYLVSRSPGGHSRVSVGALRKSLAAAAHSVPDISRTRLGVQRLSPTHFKVVSLYWIPEGENAITLGERLRLVLKRRLAELVALGPKDRVDIQVDLAGVMKRGAPSVGRAEASRRAESAFHGPVYPVDGIEGA